LDPIVLKPDEVHFFYTIIGEIQDKVLLDKYLSISSNNEKEKINRYRFEKDRHNCLVTRGLLRYVLSEYTNIPPESLEFEENRYGKLSIKPGLTNIPIKFNLSHAGGLTACALILSHDIGIDIEDSTKKIDLDIANHFFPEQESNYIKNLPEHKKKDAFFDLWTLKESYIKAKGHGLSIPLDKFSFIINKENTDICFDNSYDDNPDTFTFFRFTLLNRFKAAITVQSFFNQTLKLKVYKCVPFDKIENVK
jgi:4'-phosphopantetheinyl transferase